MIDIGDAHRLWADAHAFYQPSPMPIDCADPIVARLAAWERRMQHETPNGSLLTANRMYDQLTSGGRVHLLHVTHALPQIVERGSLYPSGGCLVGGVYCTPLDAVGDGFRMHNLGEFILTREAATAAARGLALSAPEPLIIEVQLPRNAYKGIVGIDYLRLGEIHLRIYEHLEYLLGREERHHLRDSVLGRARDSMPFLVACMTRTLRDVDSDPLSFIDWLVTTIPELPILGYFYFETLAEYLMLHSTSARALQLRDRGEFDNIPAKELLYVGLPDSLPRFDVASFRPSCSMLVERLQKIDPSIEPEHLIKYAAERMALLVCAHLLTPEMRDFDWCRLRWEFDQVRPFIGPLLGHLIHRELRTFGRYPDFYFYFDQYKALQAWNYWNHMDIVLPFNATFPKGELGLNPAYPALSTKIWKAELAKDGSLTPTKQLDVSVVPRLIDLRYTLMRSTGPEAGLAITHGHRSPSG